MNKLKELTMQLIAAQERGDRREWKKLAGQIAEMEGESDK